MSQTTYVLSQLSDMDASQFVQALGGVYEYSSWIAEQAATQRPLTSVEMLVAATRNVVDTAGIEPQPKFVRAHLELADKVAVHGELTAEPAREQSGAGLNQCSPEEFARLQTLDTQYSEKFGFPFILTVRSCDHHSVIDNFNEHMENDHDTELHASFKQIHRIAGFRLVDLIAVN